MAEYIEELENHKEMTREELLRHFQETTVAPEIMFRDETEVAMEVVYSILPLYSEDNVDYHELLKGKTAIALGFSYNEKHYLRRHISKYGGIFRFTKNGKEDFFIVHRGTWLADMLYALQKAREEGAIIIDFDTLIKNFDDSYNEDSEENLKLMEQQEIAAKSKDAPQYKIMDIEVLNKYNVSVSEISLENDIFHVVGRIEPSLCYKKGDEYITISSKETLYDCISVKGGEFIKKDSENITCLIYGNNPPEDTVKKYIGKAKVIDADSFIEWLVNQSPIHKNYWSFQKKYISSVDTKLRPYQQFFKDEIFKEWSSYYNVMLQLPTGTGKTVLFTSIINDLEKVKGTKILILAHRKELIDQISGYLTIYNIEHGIIASGRIRKKNMMVQVASVQTLTHQNNIGLLKEINPTFIIIDEAHHSLAESYTKFWNACGDCWKLGVTATPYRLNNRSFNSHFERFIEARPINEFINEGYLAEYDFLVDNPRSSLSQAIKAIKEKSSTGDYNTATLIRKLNVNEHIQRLIVCYEQYVKGKKGIVYAINKEHAHNICDAYNLIGVKAVYVDSDTPKGERKTIVEQFRNNSIQVMVNVDIFSEGFDCPDVEFIQLARPTWSLAKYLQQVGRGLRPSKSKQKTVILDNSRMFVKFGLPSDDRDWLMHFSGEPDAKSLYKQDNFEYESQLSLISKDSNELMVKMSGEAVKMDILKAENARLRAMLNNHDNEEDDNKIASLFPLDSYLHTKKKSSQIKNSPSHNSQNDINESSSYPGEDGEWYKNNKKNLMIAIVYLLAGTLLLFILYKTGLLIPLGILCLILGFLLK